MAFALRAVFTKWGALTLTHNILPWTKSEMLDPQPTVYFVSLMHSLWEIFTFMHPTILTIYGIISEKVQRNTCICRYKRICGYGFGCLIFSLWTGPTCKEMSFSVQISRTRTLVMVALIFLFCFILWIPKTKFTSILLFLLSILSSDMQPRNRQVCHFEKVNR